LIVEVDGRLFARPSGLVVDVNERVEALTDGRLPKLAL
jgi:hypothetical protein